MKRLKINWFQVLVAVYMMATFIYVFVREDSTGWAVYHNLISTYLVLLIFFGGIKKEKTEGDKSLLVGLVLLKAFNFITYYIWYKTGANWQSTPTFFCFMVMVCFLIGFYLNKKTLWK